MTRAERAVMLHNDGSACSQAVFAVFAPSLGMEERLAHKTATGLGGGVGRMGLTCGALTGGALALSLAFGSESSADQQAKLDTYERVSKLVAGIAARHGSTECRVLLGGVDLWTEEGREKVKSEDLTGKVCNRIIRDVVEYIEAALPQGENHG